MKVYQYTKSFPKEEIYGLTSQLRRAAISLPSNIVEGRGRGTDKEYKRFLMISRGSLEEVKYQIFLSKELGYMPSNSYDELLQLANRVGKLLNGLIRNWH